MKGNRIRFRFQGQIVQIRAISTAGVEVDILFSRAEVIRLAAAVKNEPVVEVRDLPPLRDL